MASDDMAQALARISIGILTWKRPSTLRYALKSYARTGLLEAAGEVILFANAADPREVALGRRYGCKILTSDENIGIGPAFARVAEAAAKPYFLFLENDWPCIEPAEVARRRLAQGVGLLERREADAVRLRHRKRYGHPLYSRARLEGREREPANLPHLIDAVHWTPHPETTFPAEIERRDIDGEPWYFTSAAHAAYTNNPILLRTAFARDEIGPRGEVPGLASEAHLQDWWCGQPLTVAMGEGLFTHRDPGKEWRRAGRIIRGWFRAGG